MPMPTMPTMKATMMNVAMILVAVLGLALSASGFAPCPVSRQTLSITTCGAPTTFFTSDSTRLFAGGFGGGGKSGADKKKKSSGGSDNKEAKLKPKQQWDRYSAFKKEPKIRVGVRCKEDESDEWLEVGRVRSKDNQYTELAVARQRAIIAEHAKRLYPLQLSSKKPIEWGYFNDKDEEWKVVDKAILNDKKVENLEKSIGFEGRPDPATGFYCVYDGGRLKLGEESSFK